MNILFSRIDNVQVGRALKLLIAGGYMAFRKDFTDSSAASGPLRILTYHDVSSPGLRVVASQLDDLIADGWTFVDPRTISSRSSSVLSGAKKRILLTFDDGYRSSYNIAQEILEPRGLRAIYFLASDFIDSVTVEASARFVRERLRAHESTPAIESTAAANMTWVQVADLVARGHVLGAHTKSHPDLPNLPTREDVLREVVAGAERIRTMTGEQPIHFAYTFGSVASVDWRTVADLQRMFAFVHTGIRGNNDELLRSGILLRDAVSESDSSALVRAIAAGWMDWRYRGARRILSSKAQAYADLDESKAAALER